MFDLETTTRAIMERMANKPSQIVMDISGSTAFKKAWDYFLESPPHDASDFTARFYALHRTLSRVTPNK
jgi:hypothetical protein